MCWVAFSRWLCCLAGIHCRCKHFCHMAFTCSLREVSPWLGTVSWNVASEKRTCRNISVLTSLSWLWSWILVIVMNITQALSSFYLTNHTWLSLCHIVILYDSLKEYARVARAVLIFIENTEDPGERSRCTLDGRGIMFDSRRLKEICVLSKASRPVLASIQPLFSECRGLLRV